MKLRFLLFVSFLCLSTMISGARAGSAQQVEPLEPEWLQQMYAEGWEKVQEGVLRRDAGGGEFEAFSYGTEGLQWVIEGYEKQLVFLEDRYNEAPSEDLAGVIEKLRGETDKLSENLDAAPSAEGFNGAALVECTESAFGGDASAGPIQSPQGITATATAYFHNACGIIGDTAAFAYADAIDAVTGLHDTHSQDDPSQGTWIDSSATASAVGSTGCSSWAQASVTINGEMVFQTPLAQSSNCSLPVLATITGPATVTTDYYTNACADVTWTASASQGNPGYTYEWYIGAALQGTGATLTRSYCNTTESVTVRVVATDTQEWSDDATFTTNIQNIGPLVATVSGPSLVSSDDECVSVRWTASASGAHPGYTYSWYLGTGTTVQGTGSTLTKEFCDTSPSGAAKVVVRDSDGHTAEAVTTPVTASITGPATVNTDYYFNSCADVTWTASASQGTPGYTYRWYIGDNSQGTGATLTKSYCNISRSATVRVVATDSQGWTDEETFTTNIQYIGRLNASVSGPSSVATTSSAPCANVTWTASASGAHPGYTYNWYIGTGTTVQGTGSTFTKQYCSGTSVTVKVVVQDSDGHTANATKTTTIDPPPPLTASISGPAAVALQTAGECRSLSWTASATGGAPSYTYTWYLGTSTTAAGTGSTLTKTFCGAQTINVKVVARDSAGSTANATKTTTITYTPLTASISGPAEVWIYTAGECVNISWTASATGGSSGYTYTWYLGTSTTAAGTGSTLTKPFCGAQTINVKVIARDSAAQTDDATFTTVIRRDLTSYGGCGGPGQPACN